MSTHDGPAWAKGALFYEIFPERFANGDPANDPPGVERWGGSPTRDNFFGGDLRGIVGGLDYLADLAVDALYLTPIFHAESNHKYDTTDYYAIDPSFGSLADFDELVREAHRRDIRIVLDGVFNHSGARFGPFEDVTRDGPASRYRDWFFVHSFPIRRDPVPSYETFVEAPYMPKLNVSNPETRAYLLDVVRYWTDRGIDGWRLDVPWLVEDGFWRDFRQVVLESNPEAFVVGEFWTLVPDQVPHPFHSVMHYPFRDGVLDFVARRRHDAPAFAASLRRAANVYALPSRPYLLNLVGSHDTGRLLTECGGDERRALLALTLLLTLLGTPMLYCGDEIGMAGDNDPGCRGTMAWERVTDGNRLFAAVRALTLLRRRCAGLRDAHLRVIRAEEDFFLYSRGTGKERVFVALNAGDRPISVAVRSGAEVLWSSPDEVRTGPSGLTLGPRSAAVLVAPTKKVFEQ